jgi:hypothetical protein
VIIALLLLAAELVLGRWGMTSRVPVAAGARTG